MSSYGMNEGQKTVRWPQYVAALAATGGALAAGENRRFVTLDVLLIISFF